MAIKAGINMTIQYHSIEELLHCLKQKGWYCNDKGQILYTRKCDNFILQSAPYKAYKQAVRFLIEQNEISPLQAVVLIKENTDRGITIFFSGKNDIVISFSKNCCKKIYGKGEFANFAWYVEQIIMPLAMQFDIQHCECSQIGGIFE